LLTQQPEAHSLLVFEVPLHGGRQTQLMPSQVKLPLDQLCRQVRVCMPVHGPLQVPASMAGQLCCCRQVRQDANGTALPRQMERQLFRRSMRLA
jgi:hypothetical protein